MSDKIGKRLRKHGNIYIYIYIYIYILNSEP